MLQIAFIIGGRSVVKRVNLNCVRCRFLRKKFIDVEMGPISQYGLKIAPANYSSQVDLCGPFIAYDPTGKRKSLKIHFAVFCNILLYYAIFSYVLLYFARLYYILL